MDIRKLQRAIVDGLEDVKAQHIVVFNTEHLSALFERVIIASGTSNRQTKALAASVRDTVKQRGLQVMRTEGEDNGEWIIVDCGAAVVHVMQPTIREYYNLEEIWGGKSVNLKMGAEPMSRLPEKAPSRVTGVSMGRGGGSGLAQPGGASSTKKDRANVARPGARPGARAAAQAAASAGVSTRPGPARSAARPTRKAAAAAAPAKTPQRRTEPASVQTVVVKAKVPRTALKSAAAAGPKTGAKAAPKSGAKTSARSTAAAGKPAPGGARKAASAAAPGPAAKKLPVKRGVPPRPARSAGTSAAKPAAKPPAKPPMKAAAKPASKPAPARKKT